MKRLYYLAAAAFVVLFVVDAAAIAQSRETFTGTVLSYGTGRNTRTSTNTFTLNITGVTSAADAQRQLSILQESGQDALLKEISGNDLGNFSVGGRLGRRINSVSVSDDDGKRRIFIVFERWLRFSELRGGYRSVDYPFGVIELSIDPSTGRGDGTYIEAAQIRWKRDKKSNQYIVEVENFATFPSKLMGVRSSGRQAP